MFKLNSQQMVWRLLQDIPDAAVLNLGPGLPQLVRDQLPSRNISVLQPTHLADMLILEGREVAENGDLIANVAGLHTAAADLPTRVLMPLFDSRGCCQLVAQCSQPATFSSRVIRAYTDFAIFDLAKGRVTLLELVEGLTLYSLQAECDVELHISPHLCLLQAPSLN